jgi:hypothetical protein
VVFLRNWWIRRKNLNTSSISRLDFIRLVATVLSVLFLYLPLSLYVLAVNLSIPLEPFSWNRVHGPLWGIILKTPSPTGKADWESWIGPVLAITSFFFVGFTRPAKHFYHRCIEILYNHIPRHFQIAALRKISERSKERRNLESVRMTPTDRLSTLNGANVDRGRTPGRIGLIMTMMTRSIQARLLCGIMRRKCQECLILRDHLVRKAPNRKFLAEAELCRLGLKVLVLLDR